MNFAQMFHHEVNLQELPAGQTLFKEGDFGDLMYVLMTGTAEITIDDRLLETAEAGTIIGELAVIADHVRTATVTAKTDCKLLPIDRKRFHFLIDQTPNFANHLLRLLAERLSKADVMLKACEKP